MITYIILNTLLIIVIATLVPTFASADDERPSRKVVDPQGTSENLEKMKGDISELLDDIRALLRAPATGAAAATAIERYTQAMAAWKVQVDELTKEERGTEAKTIFSEQLSLFTEEFEALKAMYQGMDAASALGASAKARIQSSVQTNVGLLKDDIKEIKDTIDTVPDVTEALAALGVFEASKSALGGMKKAFQGLTGKGPVGSAAAGVLGVVTSLKELILTGLKLQGISPAAWLSDKLATAVTWPFAIDEANAQMRQALSLGPLYEDRMRKIYGQGEEAYNKGYLYKLFADSAHQLELYGFTMKDSIEVWQALGKTESSYTRQSAETMKGMLHTVTAMKLMGASTESSTKGLNETIRSLGLGRDAAMDFMGAIAATSHEINFPFSNAMDALAAQGPNLGHLGDTGTQAFRDLMVASKNANIEIGDLMSTADKYKDFEKASTLAGQFNALLEGQASLDEVALSQAVMEGRYTDFYRAIQNAFKRSGQNLDDPHLTSGLAVLMGTSTGNIRRMLTANWDAEMEGAMAASLKPEDILNYDAGATARQYTGTTSLLNNAATQINQTGQFINRAIRGPLSRLAQISTGGPNLEIYDAMNFNPPGNMKSGVPGAMLNKLLDSWQTQLQLILRHSATKATSAAPLAMTDEGVPIDERGGHRGRATQEALGGGVSRGFSSAAHITFEVKDTTLGKIFDGTVVKVLDAVVGGEGT